MKSIPILGNYQKFPKKHLAGKICLSPFVSATILINGDITICGCIDWQPTIVGNIFKQPLIEILNNSISQEIRQTILNGTYDFCNAENCGIIQSNQLNDYVSLDTDLKNKIKTQVGLPREIIFSGDKTCNLSCPSCRTKVIKLNDTEIEKQLELGNLVSKNLFSEPTDNIILLTLSTSGELFASPMLLHFLNSINVDDFPNLTLHIQTNGLLAKAKWQRLGAFQNKISRITVTFDASEKNTYEIVRRGGKWEDLLDNLDFLKNKKMEQNFEFNSRMIVQQQNYKQMKSFYNLSQEYMFDRVEYGRITNWYTWSFEEFKLQDVFSIDHPEYCTAQQNLKLVYELPKTMFFSGLNIDRTL